MAVALPSPWVDTGIKINVEVTCTIQLHFLPNTAGPTPYTTSTPPPAELMTGIPLTSAWVYGDAETGGPIAGNTFFDARIAGNHTAVPAETPGGTVLLRPHDLVRPLGVGANATYQRVVYLIAPWLPAPGWKMLELVNNADPSEPSNIYPFVVTVSNARLGVRYQTFRGGDPFFATDYELEYGWFHDGFTTYQVACAGFSTDPPLFEGGSGVGWVPTAVPLLTPGLLPQGTLGLVLVRGHGTINDGTHPQITFRDIRSQGELMDTADIHEDGSHIYSPYLYPAGAGGIDVRTPQGVAAEDYMAAPYRFHYDLQVSKHGTGNTNAEIRDNFVWPIQIFPGDGSQATPQADALIEPFTAEYKVARTGHFRRTKEFNNPIKFDIRPAWAEAQPVPWDNRDYKIPIQGAPARMHPGGTSPGAPPFGFIIGYNPLLINVPVAVDVHRPLGYSNWVAQDANATIIETATQTQISVGTAGALIKRTFNASWENWVGLGTGGKTHADFVVDAYEVTKHDYYNPLQGDVWAFQHHGYFQMVIVAPVGSGGDLTVRIDGNHVDVTDDHNSVPATRVANLVVTKTPYNRSYTLLVAAGTNTLTFPLCFPEEGGPFYHGRVVSLQMVMPAVGSWVITQMRLVIPPGAGSRTMYKNDYGPPVVGNEYSHFGFVLNGAFTQGNRPDKTFKADETGERGGFSRFVRLENNSHLLISDTAADINKLEGFSGQYLASNYLAANRDEFMRELGPELAQWQWPRVPYDDLNLLPGTSIQPPCSPVCGQLKIVNGLQFRAQVNWNGGHGSLEAVVPGTDGRPAGAGVTVRAKRVDNNAIVGTAVTDGDSYAVVTPVPSNGIVEYTLEAVL